jgi:DUF1680 family protein
MQNWQPCIRLVFLGVTLSLPITACSSGSGGHGTGGAASNNGGAQGGSRNTAGTAGATGATATGGLAGVQGGGTLAGSGGKGGSGGIQTLGGAVASGGAAGQGGASSSGGKTGTAGSGGSVTSAGGASGAGGAPGSGGSTASGGIANSGGSLAKGGTTGLGGTVATGGTSASAPVRLVDATHVRLLSGSPFYDRQELHRKGYVASLDTDKLLYEFRNFAKVPQANGASSGYAGWDTGFLRGHMLGHYLSAASRMAAATGDTSFKTKVTSVVSELAKCQTAIGTGYLAPFSTTVFDWVEGKSGATNDGIVVPYYIVHKLMAGLLDANHYLGNQQALDIVTKLADYFQARLAALPAATIEKTLRTDGSGNPQNEFGGMSDSLAELSVVTGQKKYLETAKLFNRSWFITPLAAGQDNLKGLHGNTHVAQALGIARTANLSGESASLQASFWKMLTGKHAFVNGGNSFQEWLDSPGVEAGPSIDGQKVLPATTAETCNTHNMLKLTSVLFERSPRADLADYFERALYNHILASVAPDTGHVVYFTPMHGHFRTYLNGTYCCSGSGIENTPRYNEGIYFEQANSLWINLYIPNELTWEATGLTIKQEGNAAAGEPVRITIVKGGDATQATLNLRIPAWVSGTPTLMVNGDAQTQALTASSYVSLNRAWKVGDVITLTLPASLRLERAKDVSSMVAVFFGPVLLAGELGGTNMPNDFADKDVYLTTAPATVPTITGSTANPADWLAPIAGTPMAYKTQNAGSATGITFRPLYDLHHQRYAVYWPLQSSM